MRAIHGFGQSAYLNVNHLNPQFDGNDQSFPQVPINYNAFMSSIYLSGTKINQIYLGSTQIKKAYLGSTSIFSDP